MKKAEQWRALLRGSAEADYSLDHCIVAIQADARESALEEAAKHFDAGPAAHTGSWSMSFSERIRALKKPAQPELKKCPGCGAELVLVAFNGPGGEAWFSLRCNDPSGECPFEHLETKTCATERLARSFSLDKWKV
jgi:hypothetical protein